MSWDNFYFDRFNIKKTETWGDKIHIIQVVKEIVYDLQFTPLMNNIYVKYFIECKTQETIAEELNVSRRLVRIYINRIMSYLKREVDSAPLYVLQSLLLHKS